MNHIVRFFEGICKIAELVYQFPAGSLARIAGKLLHGSNNSFHFKHS